MSAPDGNRSPGTRRHRRAYWLYGLLLSLLATVWAWCFWPRGHFLADTANYRALAEGYTVYLPFCHRLLVPGLVRLLPLPVPAGFFLVSYAALAGTLTLLHALLRRLDVPPLSAAAVPVLALTCYPVGFYLSNWDSVDAVVQCLSAAFLLAVLARRRPLAAALLAAAVATKETGILLAPLLLLAAPDPGGPLAPRRLARAAFAAAPAVALFLAVRLWAPRVPGPNDFQGLAGFAELVREIWDYNCAEHGFVPRAVREFLRSYGFFWLLAGVGLMGPWRARLSLAWLYLAACGFLLCLVATDWSRMLGFGYLGIFLPTGLFLGRLERAGQERTVALLAALGVVQGHLSLIGYTEVPLAWRPLLVAAIALVFASGALAALLGWRAARRAVSP